MESYNRYMEYIFNDSDLCLVMVQIQWSIFVFHDDIDMKEMIAILFLLHTLAIKQKT